MGRWVGLLVGLATSACLTETKSGGEIVDESGSSTLGADSGSGSSVETGEPASCSPDPAPSCGDDVIDALEDCDGTTSCDACLSTKVPMTIIDGAAIGPIAIAGDGSSFARVLPDGAASAVLRRSTADGSEVWSAPLTNETVEEVALDDSGNAYAAGFLQDVPPDVTPWLASWDAAGTARWSIELPGNGAFAAIATSSNRVATVGVDIDPDAQNEVARVDVVDAAGTEVWSVTDPNLLRMTDVAFVGTDLAAIATGPGWLEGLDDARLVRYDDGGGTRWSMELPGDDEPGQRDYGVIADGADGTWVFGRAGAGPYVAHHDRDGDILDVLDCLGGATGWVENAALDDNDRLALAVQVTLQSDTRLPNHAWFPVLDNGTVTWAATFSDLSTGNAGPFAVAWRSDGALVFGWTVYGSEGGSGLSELVVLPP